MKRYEKYNPKRRLAKADQLSPDERKKFLEDSDLKEWDPICRDKEAVRILTPPPRPCRAAELLVAAQLHR